MIGVAGADDLVVRFLVEAMDAVNGQGEIEVFLVAKVAVDGPLGDAGMGGDIVHAHLVIVMLGEELGGRVEDLQAAFGIAGTHGFIIPWRRLAFKRSGEFLVFRPIGLAKRSYIS